MFKKVDGLWYYLLEDSFYREQYQAYGPFNSYDIAKGHLYDNHANPGGHSIDDNKTNKPPSAWLKEHISKARK